MKKVLISIRREIAVRVAGVQGRPHDRQGSVEDGATVKTRGLAAVLEAMEMKQPITATRTASSASCRPRSGRR